MRGLSLIGRIAWRARAHPDVVAVTDAAGPVSYRELWAGARRVGGGLRAAGLRPGDRVATAMRPSAAYVAVILGAMNAGLVPVPVNTRLTGPETSAFFEPLEPARVVADAYFADWAAALGPDVLVVPHADEPAPLAVRLGGLAGEPTDVPSHVDSPAIIFPTGGTTGLPKGAVYTHGRLWLFANSVSGTWAAAGPGDRQELYFSPFFHISLCTGLFSTLFAGGTVRILPAFDAGQSLREIGTGATVLMGSPTMFVALRTHPDFARTDRGGVGLVTFGSTHATPEFVQQLRIDFPHARLRYGYGATEYGPVTAITDEDMRAGRLDGVGRPYPDADVAIVDEHRRPLPAGEVGELAVRCPWHATGYWGRQDATAETFTAAGVLLGDLGRVDESGWVTMVGRRKELIITGGENVFPAEVESVLAGHPAVSEVCVYGADDDYWGERVEAAVVLRPGAALDLAGLRGYAAGAVASYKLPKRLRVLAELPLTPNNKPDRRALRAAGEAATGS